MAGPIKADVSAVILAGGQGRRMGGRNKALLPWDGETLLERQIQICSAWAVEIIVVSHDAEVAHLAARFPKVAVVSDPAAYQGEGPLAGLLAGAAAAACEYVWLLACDQPHISAAAASLLLARLRENGALAAALPRREGRLQPFHAVYRRQMVLEAVPQLLERGARKLTDLLDLVAWTGLDEEQFVRCGIVQAFTEDMDTPEDYRRMTNSGRTGKGRTDG